MSDINSESVRGSETLQLLSKSARSRFATQLIGAAVAFVLDYHGNAGFTLRLRLRLQDAGYRAGRVEGMEVPTAPCQWYAETPPNSKG